jgi:hypothetical protein
MRKKIIIALSLIFLGSLFFYSCTYDTLVPENINPDQPVKYSTDIQPIFTQKCISCHTGTPAPDLREGTSYASLMSGNYVNKAAPNQSVIYTETAPNGGMYKYSNNNTDSQLILLWIQQGANNN